ncbi:MAG: phage tail protein [Pseudomonadota bacterium]
MPAIQRNDPYSSYNFLITVNGISNDGNAVSGSFKEIGGLEFEVSPIEYRNGSEATTVRKMPGLVKYTNLSCKRGITGDLVFWNWVLAGVKGQVQRADGSIILLDENRAEVMRWNFRRAWPSKYTGPSLNAANNEIALESLEICHEGLEIDA